MLRETTQRKVFRSASDFSLRWSRWRFVAWLRRIVFRFAWSFCEPMEMCSDVSVKTVEFDSKKLLDVLREHQHNLYSMMWDGFDTVVMGPQQWCDIVGELADRDMNFRIDVDLLMDDYVHPKSGERHRTHKIIGLNVIVVPWIDGMFIMPKRDKP